MEQNKPTGLQALPMPRVPSAEEVHLRELTHLPFRSWCEHCVSCKSRMDNQVLLEDPAEGRRSVPTIELDYCHAKAENGEPLLTVLVGIDTWSKMALALPIPTKANSVGYQAEQVVRWSTHLGHHELTEFVSDNEPVLKSGGGHQAHSTRAWFGYNSDLCKSLSKG